MELAKTGKFEELKVQLLLIKKTWDFSERSFPQLSFVDRVRNSKSIYKWSGNLLNRWDRGSVDACDFTESESSFKVTDVSDDEVNFPNSGTISFELPNTDSSNNFYWLYPGLNIP